MQSGFFYGEIPMLTKQKINFTQVQNELLVRSDIDFGLKGLFAYIMSKPDGWEFSSYRIAQETKESDRTIKTMINKLIKLGYLIRTKHSTGKITYEAILYPECKNATVKNLHGDKSSPLSNTDKKSNTEKERKNIYKKDLPEKEKDFEQLVKQTWKDLGGETFLPLVEAQKFFLYWSESNGKKLLFERQQTFDIKKRFKRWQLNNFNQSKPQGRNNA